MRFPLVLSVTGLVTDKISAIFEKVEQDRHISSYNIAEELKVDHKTVLRHLRKSGYKKKLDILGSQLKKPNATCFHVRFFVET